MIRKLIKEREENLRLLISQEKNIEKAIEIVKTAIKKGNKIIFCGNGGSASDSNHLACEFIAKFKKTRPSIPSISLSANSSIISAIANDGYFDNVFERQIEGLGVKDDVLVAISTSGKSKNVLLAIEKAKEKNLKVIMFTGKNKTNLELDCEINAPSEKTEQIQEMHIILGHIMCELCE